MQRDNSIDLARGLAVITMMWATLARFALEEPHPLWVRLLGSFAAPTFIFLAGMMVAFVVTRPRHSLAQSLRRGGAIVLLAMLVDVLIWRQWPFFSFDVLYLIGFGTPLVYLSLRLAFAPRVLAAVAILAASPWLRAVLGYPHEPRQPRLSAASDYVVAALPALDGNALVGGYFPLFPWLGVMLLGSALGTWRWGAGRPRRLLGAKAVATSVGLLAAGVVAWLLDPGAMYVRAGFSELFYPASAGFLLLAMGVVACVLVAFEHLRDVAVLAPLSCLGQRSLFVYWWHVAVLVTASRNALEPQALPGFFLAYLLLALTSFAFVLALQHQRQRLARLPLVLRLPVGS